jgi:uncharacterized protein (TIGR02265 family)
MPERQALEQRVAHIVPTHTIRGMFMTNTVEALRRAKGEAAVQAALAGAGFAGMTWGMMSRVPLADLNKLQGSVATALMPEVGAVEDAVARMGSTGVEIFFESIAGKLIKSVAGRNPHQLMSSASSGYGFVINDYGSRSYEKIGDRMGLSTFKDDRLGPCIAYGVFWTALKTVCGVTLNVQIEQRTLLDFRFHTSW